MDEPRRVKLQLDRACNFLKDSQNPGGLWSDFLTLAGESVYWVSSYVGYNLISYDGAHGKGWLEKTGLTLRQNQGRDGGWGYGPGVPNDADSTSWCLRFLSSLRTQNSESVEKASLFLMRHQNQFDGGFRTYASPHDVGRFMRLDGSISFKGWLSSQICVTAVAVKSLMESGSSTGVGEALNFIRRSQSADGRWNSYWWTGNLYATVHCIEALKDARGVNDSELINKAQDWIARTQRDNGSWSESSENECAPFSTALALKGLMLKPKQDHSGKIRQGVEWLLTHQRSDGSWDSGYILRIPHPSMKKPWKESSWKRGGRAITAVIKDHRRLFTTATVFTALSMFARALRDEIN